MEGRALLAAERHPALVFDRRLRVRPPERLKGTEPADVMALRISRFGRGFCFRWKGVRARVVVQAAEALALALAAAGRAAVAPDHRVQVQEVPD